MSLSKDSRWSKNDTMSAGVCYGKGKSKEVQTDRHNTTIKDDRFVVLFTHIAPVAFILLTMMAYRYHTLKWLSASTS